MRLFATYLMMKKAFEPLYRPSRLLLPVVAFACFFGQIPLGLGQNNIGNLPAETQAGPLVTAKTQTRLFSQLGAYRTIHMRGQESSYTINTGLRLDEAATSAILRLNLAYSPALIHNLSHIKVYVNDQLAGTLQLNKESSGQRHVRELPIDPTLFTDFSQVKLEFIGHYTNDCEDPSHSALWLDIFPNSALVLQTKPVELIDDLALLPAPFFDKRDGGTLRLMMVMPQNPNPMVLKAAGTVASWLGALAGYRESRFTAGQTPAANQHAIVFGTAAQPPAGIDPASIAGPELRLGHDADNPAVKRLYILGRNDGELLNAAQAVVLERSVLSGQRVTIKNLELGKPRQPYDAPVFVRTDRPVRLAELVPDLKQLEVTGPSPEPIRINIKVPADLFSWAGRTVPLNLKYRYTPPSTWNDSIFNIELNEGLVQSFRLKPHDGSQEKSRLTLGLLSDSESSAQDSLRIPAFRLGGNNELSFKFRMSSQKSGACTNNQVDGMRAGIDPESTLDLSDLPHYTLMPNLIALVNGGFPFSNLADLSETALVVPSTMNLHDVSTYLSVMGQMGKWTGLPSLRVEVAKPESLDFVKNRHLFIIGDVQQTQWLQKFQQGLPMVLEQARRSLNTSEPVRWITRWWREDQAFAPTPVGRAMIESKAPLGALMGFQSPLSDKQSAVLLTGTNADSIDKVLEAMSDPGKVPLVRGAVTLVRDKDVESFDLGRTYVMGSLPVWLRARILFSEYPLLIGLAGVLAGLVIALLSYGWLSRRAQLRLQGKL